MSTEKFNIIFKLYPEEIEISKKRREIWYHRSEGDDLPAYILKDYRDGNSTKYGLDKDDFFIDKTTGAKLVRNKKTAGKPSVFKINGQYIWDGSVDRFKRAKLKTFLQEYFSPSIVRNLPETVFTKAGYYIQLEYIFYVPLALRNWTSQDLDNHSYPYIKSFNDTLVTMTTIPDDGPRILRGCYARYVDIPNEDDRRLEIKIHFCENNQRLC
jgi:hypothetical protein